MMKPQERAKRLGVSVRTLQRWDNEGSLVAYRNPHNMRYYTEEQYNAYVKGSEQKQRKQIAYARIKCGAKRRPEKPDSFLKELRERKRHYIERCDNRHRIRS